MQLRELISEQGAKFILRFGIGLVWLLFGIDKFLAPTNWFGYIPTWFTPVLQAIGLETTLFIYILAIAEALIGLALLTGFLTRWVAAVATLMLVPIILSQWFNEIAIRDIGLFAMSLALWIAPETMWSVDGWRKRK